MGPHAEVQDPAHRDAEAEAQARDEGGQEDDVREGGKGRGEAREEGREGLRREGAQGFRVRSFCAGLWEHRGRPAQMCAAAPTATWSCHGGRSATGLLSCEGRARSTVY